MSKVKEILGLVFLILIVAVAFPEQTLSILKNRFYMLIGGLLVFLILFIVWLRLRTNY